jgi:peptidoglycan L-alanyl-D-glutamate endopeptidase CwlK
MDTVSESRLSQVHPLLAEKVHAMALSLAADNIGIRVVQGLRTIEEQNALFAQRPKVTNAPGGYSMHNFGLAVDCVPSLAPLGETYQPDWDGKDAHYAAMVAAGEAQGLVSGANWHSIVDYPHMQLGGLPVTPTDQMRADLLSGGIPLVWSNFNAGAYSE